MIDKVKEFFLGLYSIYGFWRIHKTTNKNQPEIHVCSQDDDNWIPDIGIWSERGEQQFHCKICRRKEFRGGWFSVWK